MVADSKDNPLLVYQCPCGLKQPKLTYVIADYMYVTCPDMQINACWKYICAMAYTTQWPIITVAESCQMKYTGIMKYIHKPM